MAPIVKLSAKEMAAPYPSYPPSAKPCTWGGPISSVGLSLPSYLKVRSRFITSSFSFHFCGVASGRMLSQPYPALHSSGRSIQNLSIAGATRPVGPHSWSSRGRQDLFVNTSFSITESFFRANVSSCLSHLWPRKSVWRSPLAWSASWLFECHTLIWNWLFPSNFVNGNCDLLGLCSGWRGSANVVNLCSFLKFLCCFMELILWSFG